MEAAEKEGASASARRPTAAQAELLSRQAARPLAPAAAARFERESRKHWDLFYKRHGGDFFRPRHWTRRELAELLELPAEARLLDAGCGAGAFLAGLAAAGARCRLLGFDASPRALALLRAKPELGGGRVDAFEADAVSGEGLERVPAASVDAVSCVFLLSALSPERQRRALANLRRLVRPGGALYFRDYARHDAAQLRFKPGRLVSDNFYVRHDGTGSYFFDLDESRRTFSEAGFRVDSIEYVERRTVNAKENVDVPRLFLQAKLTKITDDNSVHV